VATRARDDATVPRTARPATATPAAVPTTPVAVSEVPAAGASPAAPAPAAKVSVTATPPPDAANAARVVLRFREDSWAEVYDASGTALYRDIAAAGAVHELSGAPPLRLVLGNAAGVGITVNGRNVSLGAALQATPNAQFALDRGGRVTELP
jgi:cytoskeleton protein RodZ